MFFFVITKNLNWEILTENLVTFKRWDGVQDEKYEYYGGSLKNLIYRRFHKKPIYRGKFPKKGRGFGQFADLKRGLAKKRGGVTPQCILSRHEKCESIAETNVYSLQFCGHRWCENEECVI